MGDTTAPDVTIVPVDTALSTTVAFELTASESGSTFKCTLTKNGVTVSSGSCTKTVAYTDLEPGTYIFSATATDLAGNESAVEDLFVVIRAAAAPPATQQPPAAAAPHRHPRQREHREQGHRHQERRLRRLPSWRPPS